MLDKDLATLAGRIELEAREKGFVKQRGEEPNFTGEYTNERTGIAVMLEICPSKWTRQAELELYLRKEIKGDTLSEVQDCIDTFRKATEELRRLGYKGEFELSDNALDSNYSVKANNLQKCKNVVSDFQSAAGKWTHGPVY